MHFNTRQAFCAQHISFQGNHSHTLPNGAHLDVVLNNLGNVSQKFLKLNEHLT